MGTIHLEVDAKDYDLIIECLAGNQTGLARNLTARLEAQKANASAGPSTVTVFDAAGQEVIDVKDVYDWVFEEAHGSLTLMGADGTDRAIFPSFGFMVAETQTEEAGDDPDRT